MLIGRANATCIKESWFGVEVTLQEKIIALEDKLAKRIKEYNAIQQATIAIIKYESPLLLRQLKEQLERSNKDVLRNFSHYAKQNNFIELQYNLALRSVRTYVEHNVEHLSTQLPEVDSYLIQLNRLSTQIGSIQDINKRIMIACAVLDKFPQKVIRNYTFEELLSASLKVNRQELIDNAIEHKVLPSKVEALDPSLYGRVKSHINIASEVVKKHAEKLANWLSK